MKRTSLACALMLVLYASLTPAQAVAQQEIDAASMELASKAYEDGMRAYQNEEYERAIQALRLSYTIVANPMILYNIAIIEIDAKRYEDALATMAQARQEGLPADEDAKTAARAQAVASLLEARQLATQPRRRATQTSPDHAEKDTSPRPLWPPLLVTTLGGAALCGAAVIEFRIIEQNVQLDQHAQQGDGPAYKDQIAQIEALQRRGKALLLGGSALTLTGLTWTILRVRKNAKNEPVKTGSFLIAPRIEARGAGATLMLRF